MKKIIISSLILLNLYAGDISVENVYIKESLPHSNISAFFLTLSNNSDQNISLLKAKTNLTNTTELHTHINDNGKMTMLALDKIDIPAHSKTELKPGGLHIMLFDLKQKIDQNSKINLNLYFDNNTSLKLENIPVKAIHSQQ